MADQSGWVVTPRHIGIILGSAVAAVIISLIGVFGPMIRGAQSGGVNVKQEIAVVKARLDTLEGHLYGHIDEKWHQEAGEEFAKIRNQIIHIEELDRRILRDHEQFRKKGYDVP